MSPRTSLSVAGTLLIAGLHATDAHAFCRTLTASVPPGYDPGYRGCYAPPAGSDAYDVYWSNLCVGYSLQRDASPLRHITLEQATKVAAKAFAQWTAAACGRAAPSIEAHDLGPVDCKLAQYNSSQPNQHVIVFRDERWPYDDSSNTLGLTTVTFDVTNGEIFDADMELNSHDYDLVAVPPVPIGSYDLASVVTHEAGHFLGLAHSGESTAVMYAHYHPGSTALTKDDTDGICSAYPPGGDRITSAGPKKGAACDATPRHGFSAACAKGEGSGASNAAALTADSAQRTGCAVAGAGAVGVSGPAIASWLVLTGTFACRLPSGRRRRRRDGERRQGG
jgi:hypothetical protein